MVAKYSAEKISEIRDRVRLEEWVGRTVELQRKGRRWVGLCPFHSEKTPSFGVSPDKQLFHCFGCGAGGDLFDYVMRLEGLDFPSAIQLLAEAHGIELPSQTPENGESRQQEEHRDRLFGVNAVAQEVFRSALQQSPECVQYLHEERGLSDATINRFEIGWAPAGWQHLVDHLQKRKISPDPGLELGLLGRRVRDGRPYDRLRGRITFPIRIANGRIAGFGARRADWIDKEGPKYLNSPESPIYDKSKLLYGIHLARDEIRKRRQALLTEGYLDVIALSQADFPHAVAGCGTALTFAHAKTLQRLTDEVITIFDGDNAGRKATHKAAILLLKAGVHVRVVEMPENQDPDDFLRISGAKALRERLLSAPSAIDFFLAQARSIVSGGGIAGIQKALETVRPLLEAINDPLARDIAFDACARELRVDQRTFRRHLGGLAPISSQRKRRDLSHQKPQQTLNNNEPSAPLPHVVETELLKMLLEDPHRVLSALESQDAIHAFSSIPLHAAVKSVAEATREGRQFTGPEALDVMRRNGLTHEPWLAEVRARLLREEEPEPHELEALIERLIKGHRQGRIRALREQLARCTDIDEQARLLDEVRRVQSGGR